jgi:hypothetical protein
MRCIRCNKPVTRYAKAIPGPVAYGAPLARGWGPKCAALTFGPKTKPPASSAPPAIVSRRRSVQADPLQVDWVEEVAA